MELQDLPQVLRDQIAKDFGDYKVSTTVEEVPTLNLGDENIFVVPEECFDWEAAVHIVASYNVETKGADFNPLGGPRAYIARKTDLDQPAWLVYEYLEEYALYIFCVL